MTATVFEFEVPLLDGKPPLTANQRLHWAEKARRTRDVRQAIGWRACTVPCPKGVRLMVQLHYRPGDSRRRDAPNLWPTQKAAVDGLVDAGLVPDDTAEWVQELTPLIHAGKEERRLWLAVAVIAEVDR